MYLVTGVNGQNANDKVSYPAKDAKTANHMFADLARNGYIDIKIVDNESGKLMGLLELEKIAS